MEASIVAKWHKNKSTTRERNISHLADEVAQDRSKHQDDGRGGAFVVHAAPQGSPYALFQLIIALALSAPMNFHCASARRAPDPADKPLKVLPAIFVLEVGGDDPQCLYGNAFSTPLRGAVRPAHLLVTSAKKYLLAFFSLFHPLLSLQHASKIEGFSPSLLFLSFHEYSQRILKQAHATYHRDSAPLYDIAIVTLPLVRS